MKRKYLLSLFVLLLMIMGINNVEARECYYNLSGDRKIIISTSKEGNTVKTKINDGTIKGWGYENAFNFIEDGSLSEEDQCFNTINVCAYAYKASAFSVKGYIGVFGSSLDPTTVDKEISKSFTKEKGFFSALFNGEAASCTTVEYSGDDKQQMISEGKFVSSCNKFTTLLNDVILAYSAYGNCEKVFNNSNKENKDEITQASCKSKALSKANNSVDTLKSACKSILNNESVSAEDGCAASCLNVTKSLKQLQDVYVGSDDGEGDCGFSDKLVGFIVNILNWIKYIIPVAVIILGILDFIKAIGSDKDSEMKKAQGRFIKRLIAAALIFIVPLIIVFVLEKMGFDVYGCGFIDV